MPDQEKARIIEQLTLRKLEYVRKYLESKGQIKGGTRVAVRDRLTELIETDDSVFDDLKGLLGELDAWGDQRLKIAKFDLRDLKAFRSSGMVKKQIERAGMSSLLEGEIAIEPPAELTPMVIRHIDDSEKRMLQLYAAKSRTVDVADNSIPPKTDKRYPGIIFKPYRQEIQKAVDFAEINLTNGDALFSTTLLRSGTAYRAEFNELYEVFQPLIELQMASPVVLYKAIKTIPTLPQKEVLTPSKDKRTSSGGKIAHRSNSPKVDLRLDSDIVLSDKATAQLDNVTCNCYWAQTKTLLESVHTWVYAPEAEISVMGQVREASVRHVLQRILQVN
jgi:hypothetical protein